MKADIHPAYNEKVAVTCACGNSFETGSTASEIHVEICSNCHPFYTGKQKLVDTAGRVDKFTKKLQDTADKQAKARSGKKARTQRRDTTVKLG